MKLFLIITAMLLTTSQVFAAETLRCQGEGEIQYGVPNQFTFGEDWFYAGCVNKKGKQFNILVEGIGVGLQYQQYQYLILTCPLVRESKLTSRKYYGVLASGSIYVGAQAGVYVNKNLGVCVLTGVTKLGLGAAVSFEQLEIRNY